MIVADRRITVCNLTVIVSDVIKNDSGVDTGFGRVFMNTRCLKHLYDKRPAVEYEFLVNRKQASHLLKKHKLNIYNQNEKL